MRLANSVGLIDADDCVDGFGLFWRSRECVGDDVVFPCYFPNVRCVFGNVRQLGRLSAVVWFRLLPHRRDQSVLVGVQREWASFDQVPEVARCQVRAQQFAVESREIDFRRGSQLPAEETEWLPHAADVLFQLRADGELGGVDGEGEGRVGNRVARAVPFLGACREFKAQCRKLPGLGVPRFALWADVLLLRL